MRTTADERAAAAIAESPWIELDWSSGGPYGAATMLKQPRPCIICGKPAWLLSPRKKTPAHKTCAEQGYLVVALSRILAAITRDE